MSPRTTKPQRAPGDPALIDRDHGTRPESEYLRRDQAARFLGLATGTLANWASAGVGPSYHRVGGRTVVYERAELRRFLAGGLVPTVGAR